MHSEVWRFRLHTCIYNDVIFCVEYEPPYTICYRLYMDVEAILANLLLDRGDQDRESGYGGMYIQ